MDWLSFVELVKSYAVKRVAIAFSDSSILQGLKSQRVNINKYSASFCVFGAFILLLGCTKKDFTIQNLNNNKIEVFGHAGMGTKGNCPLNSLKSIQTCIDAGASGVEIDVQLTKDNVLVAFHDEDLSTSTNKSGKIEALNWSEIEGATYKSVSAKRHSVMQLNELFNPLEYNNDFSFTIEVKTNKVVISEDYVKQYINALSSFIDKNQLAKVILLEFTKIELAKAMIEARPDIKVFIYNEYNFAVEKALELGADGITCSFDWLTPEQVQAAHDQNLSVALFGCKTNKENIEAIELSPDYIQTSEVKHLVRVLN